MRTDDLMVHWRNNDNVPDLMEPILDTVRLTLVTPAAVIDSRGDNWMSLACESTSTDCPIEYTCVGSQPHLPGWCIK